MRKLFITYLLSVLVLGALFFDGCTPPPPLATPTPTEAVRPPGWQGEWNMTLEEAKREGSLIIYSTWGGEVKSPFTAFFKEKYGIGIEWVSGQSAAMEAKLYAERRAGLYQGDVYLAGVGTPLNSLKPNGILDPLEPLLLLPEVTSSEAWNGNSLPFIDPEHYIIALAMSVKVPIDVNTQLVKPGEIVSFRDLLNPRWKGKIVMLDPTASGTANAWVCLVAEDIMGLEFIKELAKQELVIVRDDRLAAEWVARGKYPILIGARTDVVTVFRSEGAPMSGIIPAEGTWVAATTAMCVINKPTHPAARKIFANWVLTKEAQTLYSKLSGVQTAREDVPTDHLYQLEVRDPKVKYPRSDTVESNLLRPKYKELAKEIFGASLE